MANIDYVCGARHVGDRYTNPAATVTLHERLWAYCARGGTAHHEWQRVSTTTIDAIEAGARERRVRLTGSVAGPLGRGRLAQHAARG